MPGLYLLCGLTQTHWLWSNQSVLLSGQPKSKKRIVNITILNCIISSTKFTKYSGGGEHKEGIKKKRL